MRSIKYLVGVTIVFLFLPIFLSVGAYVFRAQIQQGKFLPELGPLLSLAFPADDLYAPLAVESLSPEKSTYKFKFPHKYLGNHAVFIEIPSEIRPEFKIEKDLSLTVKIQEGDKLLLWKSEDRGSPFLGKGRYGFYYVGYKVPKDVPVSKEISMEINIGKDVDHFLKTHEKARLIVRKSSDE